MLDFGLSATVAGGPLAADRREPPDGDTLAGIALDETRLPPGAGTPVAASFASEGGAIKGTAAYMSPEQARGEVVSSASDMYSFGLVLQELFTGQRPYQRDLAFHELLEQRGRGVSIEPAGLSAALSQLIGRLKSLAPTQRPTAVESADRLQWIAAAQNRLRRNLIAAAVVVAAVLGAAKYTIDLTRERNAAIAARDEADQRRGQAEGLIGFMVGDLREKLTPVGRLQILDEVGKQALNYFASVPADTLTDEELYRRSQALHQLGQIRQARADLTGALTAYEESLAQAKAVVNRRPDNATWQLGLGTSHFYAGDVKMRRGDLAGALAHFEAYKSIAERLVAVSPKDFTYRLELSYGFSNLAAIYQRQGNVIAARTQLEHVAAIQSVLAEERPEDTTLGASRANSLNRLGIVQDALGDYDAAAATFARELDMHQQMLAQDPRNAPTRRRLVVSHAYRAATIRALGRLDEAARHLQVAVREAEGLVALDPTNANWQRDLGVSEVGLARIELEQQQPSLATNRLRRAIRVLTPLATRASQRAGPQGDLARAHAALADARRARGDDLGAAAAARSAVSLLAPFAVRDLPPEVVRDLVTALTASAAANITASTRQLQETLSIFEPIARSSTDRNVLEPFVRALLVLGRVKDATPHYERLVAMGYREPALLALWQREASRAIPLVPKERS